VDWFCQSCIRAKEKNKTKPAGDSASPSGSAEVPTKTPAKRKAPAAKGRPSMSFCLHLQGHPFLYCSFFINGIRIVVVSFLASAKKGKAREASDEDEGSE
jgi:hypothetical protein